MTHHTGTEFSGMHEMFEVFANGPKPSWPERTFVVGFLFTKNVDWTMVHLIRKNRPKWQAGRYNGIGGHVEDNETIAEAMKREFLEETGLLVPAERWRLFAQIKHQRNLICFFTHTRDFTHLTAIESGKVEMPRSLTDESVEGFYAESVPYQKCIGNLSWLIPLAQSRSLEVALVEDLSDFGTKGGKYDG
jgi:8-oxo-dGTP pyrophosphatase MutT (NUDIX family)